MAEPTKRLTSSTLLYVGSQVSPGPPKPMGRSMDGLASPARAERVFWRRGDEHRQVPAVERHHWEGCVSDRSSQPSHRPQRQEFIQSPHRGHFVTGRGRDRMGVTGDRRKPGRIDAIELELGKEQRVRNDVKTFAEVQ